MAQVLHMAQALSVAQTTLTKEPKFFMLEMFDGTRSLFRGFVHVTNITLKL
jgi:hypothetical protein